LLVNAGWAVSLQLSVRPSFQCCTRFRLGVPRFSRKRFFFFTFPFPAGFFSNSLWTIFLSDPGVSSAFPFCLPAKNDFFLGPLNPFPDLSWRPALAFSPKFSSAPDCVPSGLGAPWFLADSARGRIFTFFQSVLAWSPRHFARFVVPRDPFLF